MNSASVLQMYGKYCTYNKFFLSLVPTMEPERAQRSEFIAFNFMPNKFSEYLRLGWEKKNRLSFAETIFIVQYSSRF
jgi:hypothetical protein